MADACCDLLCLDLRTAERVRAKLPDAQVLARMATMARAAADPTRLALLAALEAADELCVCDLTWIVGKPQNLVSHHLRKLRDAGVVTTRREAKIVFYCITQSGRTLVQTLTQVQSSA